MVSDGTNAGVERTAAIPSVWLTVAGILLYAFLELGGKFALDNVLLALPSITFAYVLAIYLYYTVPGLVYHRRIVVLVAAFVAAGAIGLYLAGSRHLWDCVIELSVVLIGGGAVGYMTRAGRKPLEAYVIGAGVIVVLLVALYLPRWPESMDAMKEQWNQWVSVFERELGDAAITGSEFDDRLINMKKSGEVIIRLVPASTIMSAIIQFSVGFLAFFVRSVKDPVQVRQVADFRGWKVPFGFMPVVIVLGLMRLLGGHVLEVVADNGILILAVYYCVGGLMLAEFYMKHLKVSMLSRVSYYMFLFFISLIGVFNMTIAIVAFLIAAGAGFIDSFADWRSKMSPDFGLKNE